MQPATAEPVANASEFAPRRARTDRVQLVPPPAEKPELTLSRNAIAVAQGIEKLQESERQARAENSDLKARLEQHQVKINELTNRIERLGIEHDAERAERIRLASGLEHIIHAAHKLAEQPDGRREDEQDG